MWYNALMVEFLKKLEAKWRYDQAMIDADIEGLPRDPESEVLIEQWREEGVPIEERIERLKQLYRSRSDKLAE